MLPQSVQHGAAARAEGATTLDDRVLLLPPELRTIILHSLTPSLTREAARSLASTGSAALKTVLEARTDLQSFTVHRALAPRVALLRFRAGSEPNSKAQVRCRHGEWVIRVSLPWHAVPRVAAEQQHEDAVVPADAALFWLSPAAIENAVEVYTLGWASQERMFALPPGMGALKTLCARMCILEGDWLPQSSVGSMRKLAIDEARVERLPPGMGALTELHLTTCQGLAADWLPESSRPLVRILELGRCYTIEGVPADMLSLECIDVANCHRLVADWLPDSSRARVRVIMGGSSLCCLPTGLQTLEYVRFSCMFQLIADWLPVSSTARLRVVDATLSNIKSLPENIPHLEAVRVFQCHHLAADWLPASSAQRMRFVDARCSNMQRLPSGMTALAAVDVTGCPSLVEDWLPASSAADVRQLGGAEDTKAKMLRRDRSALLKLLPPRCWPSQQIQIRGPARCWQFDKMASALWQAYADAYGSMD